jgi:hypothetical protein
LTTLVYKPQHWFAQEFKPTSIPILISNFTNKGCVALWPCHFTLKIYFKAKEELWKLKYNFTMQKYNLPKNPLKKETKIFQDVI